MNPYLYNPAYAGVEGHTALYVLGNQQWMSIDGAPRLFNASFHTPLKGGIGIGFMAYNQSIGSLMNNSSAKGSVSYLLTMDREHHFRFGMSVGGGTSFIDLGELDDPFDPAFTQVGDQNSFVTADFGATYHFGHFNVGFSIPSLIGYDYLEAQGLAPIRVTPLDHLMFKANYRGHINDDIAIEPHIIYRYNAFEPDQYEGTVILHIYHLVWAGVSYRQDNNIIGTVGVKIAEKLGIGLSYELGNSNISTLLGPSFEFHIGYHLSSRRRHHAHSSSFIKSHRLTPEERAKKEALEQEKKLAELQASREAAQQKTADSDALTIAAPVAAAEVVEEKEDPCQVIDNQDETIRTNEFGEEEKAVVIRCINEQGDTEEAVAWVPVDEDWELVKGEEPLTRVSSDGTKEIGVKYMRTKPDGTQEMVVKWEVVGTAAATAAILASADEPVAEPVVEETVQQPIVEDTQPEPTPVPTDPEEDNRSHEELAQSEEPLVVTRGNNMLELPAGNYVVAGAFTEFDHAEDFSDEMFNKGFHDTIVGYLSARGYYYVVIFRSDSVQRAVAERNRVRNRPDFKDVWVLTVNQ